MIGKLLNGRYQIEKPLGKGGFGETFLARDTQMPKEPQCVVKHLHPVSNNPQVLEVATRLFRKEAEVLAELGEHPQIPRLYAYFTQGEDFYLVQEFIEGKDLSYEMVKPWTPSAVCDLIAEMMEILEFVHSRGVIYRDIKPQNIIRRNRDGKLVLIDFGAIKEISQTAMAETGMMSASVAVGSIGYMAPEQGQGKPRITSDIYSVGMMAIQALTGKQPMELAEDPKTGEVAWRHLVDLDNQLLDVISKMVRYAHRERYDNARAVLSALTGYRTNIKIGAEGEQGERQATPVSKTASALFESGNAKYFSKDYRGAIDDFDHAIQLDPNYAQAYNNRGNAKFKLQDHRGAIADYDRAIQLDPNSAATYYNRGLVNRDISNTSAAVRDFTRARDLYQAQGNTYWAEEARQRLNEL